MKLCQADEGRRCLVLAAAGDGDGDVVSGRGPGGPTRHPHAMSGRPEARTAKGARQPARAA